MITINTTIYNNDFKKEYTKLTQKLDLNTLTCPCCKHKGMKVHGYYKRNIVLEDTKFKVNIMRAKCYHCSSTHAIVPKNIVPYKQIPANIIHKIILKEIVASALIDETQINRILRVFRKKWEFLLDTIRCDIKWKIEVVIDFCFLRLNRTFFQERKLKNIKTT